MSTLTATASLSPVRSFPVQVEETVQVQVQPNNGTLKKWTCERSVNQSACCKTIKELYLKNKRSARGNTVLQDSEQASKHQPLVVSMEPMDLHAGLGLGLG